MSVRELFDQVQARLQANPSRIQGMNATYKFQLSGEGGGNFYLRIQDGTVEVGEGDVAAGCTILMSADDFRALVGGQLNPVAAFMGGKLRIQGDMALAMKLQGVLQ